MASRSGAEPECPELLNTPSLKLF